MTIGDALHCDECGKELKFLDEFVICRGCLTLHRRKKLYRKHILSKTLQFCMRYL